MSVTIAGVTGDCGPGNPGCEEWNATHQAPFLSGNDTFCVLNMPTLCNGGEVEFALVDGSIRVTVTVDGQSFRKTIAGTTVDCQDVGNLPQIPSSPFTCDWSAATCSIP